MPLKMAGAAVTVYEPQQEQAHHERAMMSLDEQWRMIKDNHLLMVARGVASPRIPEARNFWLISLRLWTSEGEVMEEQAFRASLADPALSHALDRRVLHEFFHHAAPAVASKGLSVALPLSVAGLISTTLIDELLAQLEQSTLPGRLLHLIVPAEALLLNPQESTKAIQTLRRAGCHIIVSQIGRDLQIFNLMTKSLADYLLLDSELSASIHGNMMDEMLVSIIQATPSAWG